MYRLAQFGLGRLGRHTLSILDRMERVEIVAGADPLADAREHFERDYGGKAYADHETLLADRDELDVVNVVSPHALHYEQTMAALDAGLSVHVEKPMVTDVSDAVALADAARGRDEVVQVGYQRHFDPRFSELREIVEEGRIGDLGGVNYFLEQDWIDHQSGLWRSDPSLSGGGQLYDSGSHLLDALLWTTGTTARTVSAEITYEKPGVDVHSSLSIGLDRNGERVPASVYVTGDGPTGPSMREGFYLWGSEGSAEYTEDGIEIRRADGPIERIEVGAPDFETQNERKLKAFLETVAGERANSVPPSIGLQVIALTEAAYLADERDASVDVQQLIEDAHSP